MKRPSLQAQDRAPLQPRIRFGRSSWLVLFLAMLALSVACGGPLGPFSGGRLSGHEGEWPRDWNEFTGFDTLQLETGGEDPHSVNLWFVVFGGSPYLATSLLAGSEDPADRQWVQNITVDLRVRVRVEELVYPAELREVEDPTRIGHIFEAFLIKYPNLDVSRRESARYFEIVTRGPASS